MVLVVVGSYGDTDSGTYASPPSYPVFSLSLNVVNDWDDFPQFNIMSGRIDKVVA